MKVFIIAAALFAVALSAPAGDAPADSTKDDLLKQAGALKDLAGGEIEKLKAAGKDILAKELGVLEKAVIDLEARVETQHPTTELGKLALSAEETVLKGLEHKLEDFIKGLAGKTEGSFFADGDAATKDELIKDASALKNLAAGEIEKLKAAGKDLLAKEVEVIEKAVEDLEKRVETQHPTTEVGKIALQAEETVLKGLEHKLQDFLKGLTGKTGGAFFADDTTKDDLLKQAGALKDLAGGEIEKLKAAGKDLLAKELGVLEKAVIDLEARVETQHPTTELGKIALSAEETVLKGLEHKLEDFIKGLAGKTEGAFFADTTKDDLLKEAGALKVLASGELAKLKQEGKTLLAHELEVLEKSVEDLEKRVETQHPTTEVGQIALKAEETVLKGLEGKLHEFISKLGAPKF